MSQSPLMAHEFFRDYFSPHVAVMVSTDADDLCVKNNLSFVQMIQPFCNLSQEATIRDPSNLAHVIHGLRVKLHASDEPPVSVSAAKKLMSDAVANASNTPIQHQWITVGQYDVQFSAQAPWFEAYRECFLKSFNPLDHEFHAKNLSCIFVVSSHHDDAIQQFHRLSTAQHQQQHGGPPAPGMPPVDPTKGPRWFCPNIFKYYVLLHDVHLCDEAKANSIYTNMKATFGQHACHLLIINSRSEEDAESLRQSNDTQSVPPDPWSQYLRQTVSQHNGDLGVDAESLEPGAQSFPGHVSEASVDSQNVEEANEVTEGPSLSSHPLHVEPEELSTSGAEEESDGNTMSMKNSTSAAYNLSEKQQGYHGAYLTASDQDRIKILMQEYIVRGLIPWAEQYLKILNEQLMSRKGIHRSIFSGAKKFFGGSKQGSHQNKEQKVTSSYSSESAEMQMRRLADLAFLFHLYELSYSWYHAARKDFTNDHAWKHFAAASEMCALSVFMQGVEKPLPHQYLEVAVNTYNSTCQAPQLATRSTLWSTEALKAKNQFAEAAHLFIRMTSEDSDLRSGLLLEQAAICFMRLTSKRGPMLRKYSFHMILAGHRFSKAGQRRHALRCYNNALQVYDRRGWTLAQDHVQFTIGRQAINLKETESALSALRTLFSGQATRQPASQQASFLREFLFVYKQYSSTQQEKGGKSQLAELPVPCLVPNAVRVIPGYVQGTTVKRPNPIAASLEELCSRDIVGSMPVFKATQPLLDSCTSNIRPAVMPVYEVLLYEISVENPLNVPLNLSNLMLLWKMTDKNDMTITNEESVSKNPVADQIVETSVIQTLQLQPNERTQISLWLSPHVVGELHVTAVAYTITAPVTSDASHDSPVSLRGKLMLEVRGPRLNKTKAEMSTKQYGVDYRLQCSVVPAAPKLQIMMEEIPDSLLCGELRQCALRITNTSTVPLKRLLVATDSPCIVALGEVCAEKPTPVDWMKGTKLSRVSEWLSESSTSYHREMSLPAGSLQTGQTVWLSLCLHGDVKPGLTECMITVCYTPEQAHPNIKYLVVHLPVSFFSLSSLNISASVLPSTQPSVSPDQSELRNLTASLQVDALHEGTDCVFSLLQVSCASDRYNLKPLATYSSTDLCVSTSQTCLLSLEAEYLQPQPGKLCFSDVQLQGNSVRCSSEPFSKYFWSQYSPLEPIKQLLAPPNPNAMLDTAVPQPTENSLVHRAHDCNITLIIFWKATVRQQSGNSSVHVGQQFLRLSRIHDSASLQEAQQMAVESAEPLSLRAAVTETRDTEPRAETFAALLRCRLSATSHVTTTPSETPADVNVDVKLQNCSETSLQVIVEAQTERGVSWCGRHTLRCSLDPLGSTSLSLTASIPLPGLYNLSNYVIVKTMLSSQQTSDSEWVVQAPAPPCDVLLEFKPS